MGNAAIGFDRLTDAVTFTANGGSWDTRYPVTNLGVDPVAQVARATSPLASATRFAGSLATPRGLRMFGFIGHNASVQGQFRIIGYANTNRTGPVFNTGFLDFWPVAFPFGSVPYGHPSFWSGKYPQSEIDKYDDQPTRIVYLNSNLLIGSFTVEIVDPNNPKGAFSCGMFEVSDAEVVPLGFALGAQLGFRFRTTSQEHLAGGKSFERQRKPRKFSGTIDFAEETWAMARFWEHWRRNDLDTPFMWLQDPEDPYNVTRNGWLARNVDPGMFGLVQDDRASVPINIEEVL